MNTNIVPVADIERMAGAVARSGLFGVKTQEQAMALMLIAQAEGMHPAIAARDYHIIQGRPALKADAMLARFQQAGGKVEWKEYTDTKVVGVFSHPSGGSVSVEWSIEMANKAGLTAKTKHGSNTRVRCFAQGALAKASARCSQALSAGSIRQKKFRISIRQKRCDAS